MCGRGRSRAMTARLKTFCYPDIGARGAIQVRGKDGVHPDFVRVCDMNSFLAR